MKREFAPGIFESQARIKTIYWVAIVAIVVLTPFSIKNFLDHSYMLGMGALLVIILLGFNGWFSLKGEYYPSLTLFGLAPVMIVSLFYAFQKAGVIGALWCYPTIISFYFMLPERQAWLANSVLMLMALPSAIVFLEPSLSFRVVATLICVSTFSVIFLRIITSQQIQLKELAMTDALTGLSNRVLLHSSLEHAVYKFERDQVPVSLISMDLDHFKKINDDLGHAAGDQVLKEMGKLLLQRVRKSDRIFRIGGEEFLIVLYEADLEQAVQLAEFLREEVASREFLPGRTVTASGGVAVYQAGEHWRDWMKRSDDNLYLAKKQGRNCIVS